MIATMNRSVRKLLCRHISPARLAGAALASIAGMAIVMLSVQFYCDVLPVFTQGDSFLRGEYVIASKRVSTLSTLAGKSNAFTPQEVGDLRDQPFARGVAPFTPSLFHVSAGVAMKGKGLRLSTEMFFESVPDAYVDIDLDKWRFDEASGTIPIIIPRNYLNLYNFGFAQSRGLPRLSEGLVSAIEMDISLRGNGQSRHFKGHIAGFSDRLNTILVPQAFMDWANRTFAPGREAAPSRLIIDARNAADPRIADYFAAHGYEAEGTALNAGKTVHFLSVLTTMVACVGVFISLLSLYILVLSVYLLLQQDASRLQDLLLLGYSLRQVSAPYYALTTLMHLGVLLVAGGVAWAVRAQYLGVLRGFLPQAAAQPWWPALLTGFLLFAGLAVLNVLSIRLRMRSIWRMAANKDTHV